MTLFKRAQIPPQVTIGAFVFAGSGKIFSRGPAFSKSCPAAICSRVDLEGDDERMYGR